MVEWNTGTPPSIHDAEKGGEMGRGYHWWLDEVASAGRENLDADHVARYDTKEDADAASELVLLQQLGLHRHSEVVDLGAGTGQFALAAASACARVVAVDVSSVMLQRLQAKINEAHLSNVEVVQSGFLTYEHRGRPADFVYTRFALHHLPDFWKAVALARVRRIVRPGGVLRLWDVVYDFDPTAAAERIEAWCATGGSSVEGEWSRAELEEHVRDEHSTFRWLLEPMIERCGFAIEEAVYSADGIFGKYVARAT
jgi:ubiquinone/menaquinone biosynthesis C-methylase UbiE